MKIFVLPSLIIFAATSMSGHRQASGSAERVAMNHLGIKFRAELGDALECLIVDVANPEPPRIPAGPFEIVQQAPEEIAVDRISLGEGAMHMHQVFSQVHHPRQVPDFAGLIHCVWTRAAIFSDVDRGRVPIFARESRPPIKD